MPTSLPSLEDNLPNGAVFQLVRRADGAYRFAYLSAGVAPLFGVKPRDVLVDSEALFRRVLDADRPRLWVALEHSAGLAGLLDLAVRVWGPGSEVRWAEVHGRPAVQPDGSVRWDGFLFDTTERKRAELLLSAGNRVSALLAGFPPEAELWPALLPAVGEELLWDVAECWRRAADGALARTAVWHRADPLFRRFADRSAAWRFPTGDGLPGLAWRVGTPVWMPDLEAHPFFRRKDLVAEAGLRCGVGVPVGVGGECVGVVALFGRPVGQDHPPMRGFLASLGAMLTRYLEHLRAEDAVRSARDAAERANRAKDRFLANVSHELRTPLTGILGTVELALGEPAPPRLRERLTTVRHCADALLGIVNDLLDYAKGDAGRIELRPAPCDLRAEVERAVRPLADRAARKRVRFRVRVANDVPRWVVADAPRLRQVLVNLAGNAVKFTEKGKVSVTVSVPVENNSQCLRTDTDTVTLHFSVKDTGIGIPADKLKQVFRPFEQADGSTARKYGGTGLGLTIAAKLVRLMGGRLRVRSEVGAGTTFRFAVALPVATEPPTDPGGPAVAPARPLRVLVAEDDRVVRAVAVELLRRAGHRVTAVRDGPAAVEACRAKRFDAVLMDLHMPGMAGLDAAAAIRLLGRRVPIVAFTASATGADVAACRAAGLDGFVSKPIDPTALAAALAAVTGGPQNPPSAPVPTAGEAGDVLDPMPVVMGRIGGDPGLLARLAPALIADVARLRAKATDAADRGDRAGVAAAAHSLAGLVGLVSTRGHRAARRLESAAHDGHDYTAELAEVVRIADALPAALARSADAPG